MRLITLLIQATLTGNVTHFRPAENFNNLTNPKWRHIACEQALLLEESQISAAMLLHCKNLEGYGWSRCTSQISDRDG